MLSNEVLSGSKTMLLAGLLAGSIFVFALAAQTPEQPSAQSPAPAPAQPAAPAPAPAGQSQASPARYSYQPYRAPRRAAALYGLFWGVEGLRVKLVESGEMIKFTYSVIDPDKAKVLNDKKAEPVLIDPQAGVQLVVPQLEKVGKLRQSSTPEMGKTYWMAFSNKGGVVKRGDRVNVVIGQFRAEGLIVD